MNFNDLNWHDATIKNILIDRTDPGNKDIIIFEIDWQESNKTTLIFEDVYLAIMNLNFGIQAEESILDAALLDTNNEYLVNLKSKWKGALNNIHLNTILR